MHRCILILAVFCISATDCIIDWNRRNVGIREATGKNDGLYVQRFLANCDLQGNYSWCACYVLSGHLACGISKSELPTCPAWSPCWFNKNVHWRKGESASMLKSGDVFGLWIKSKNRIAHVGFIFFIQDDWVFTIEGNTRDAGNKLQPGDGVHIMRRHVNELSVVSNWIPKARFHTVQKKETLYRLSVMYKVKVDQLRQWNNLTSDIISIGQRLRVG